MMANHTRSEATGWVGWVVFAGTLLLLDGIFQFIMGLVSAFNNQYYAVATQSHVLVWNYTTWGWMQMLLGLVLATAGLSLFSGSTFGRVTGVVVAGLSTIANLAFIGVYPIWSLVVIAVDVLVIYALIVHGGEMRPIEG
jgi:hypothetical protein